MERKASAIWQGGLKDGKGTVSTGSGVLSKTSYSFVDRFESGKGTNPEELIAAAHAGCFSMALSAQLGEAGMKADSIETKANLTLEKIASRYGFCVATASGDALARDPQLPGGRDDVRDRSVSVAMHMIRRVLIGEDLPL